MDLLAHTPDQERSQGLATETISTSPDSDTGFISDSSPLDSPSFPSQENVDDSAHYNENDELSLPLTNGAAGNESTNNAGNDPSHLLRQEQEQALHKVETELQNGTLNSEPKIPSPNPNDSGIHSSENGDTDIGNPSESSIELATKDTVVKNGNKFPSDIIEEPKTLPHENEEQSNVSQNLERLDATESVSIPKQKEVLAEANQSGNQSSKEADAKDVSNDVSDNQSINGSESNNGDIDLKTPEGSISQSPDDSETLPEKEKEEDDYVDILGNGLLKKKVLSPGLGIDSRPSNGDMVTLKVKGYLENGTIIQDEQITFALNDGDVIVAFELACALMERGEKCELTTSSKYAYGELGREPDIPKNASLTFNLDLVDVKAAVNVASLSCDQRLQMGEQKRERGNYLFKRADYSGAINSYGKAVKVLDDTDLNGGLDEASRTKLADCCAKCYNNMAACQLKIEALDAAIRSCEKVLVHQPDNVKALFRLGKAEGAKGQVNQAISHLKQAIKLDPESKIMHQELLNLTRRRNKETESERQLYQRMLGVKEGGKGSKASSSQGRNSYNVLKWTLALGAVTAAVVSVGFTWYRNS